jgi:hypothetical protein
MEDATRSPDETTQRSVLWKGSAELEGKAHTSIIPRESSPCFLEQGNTTSTLETRTEHSSANNSLSLEANGVNDEVLVPSSSQERPGRQQPLGAGSLRLSPRRTQGHRGELRTEYSASHTVPIHLAKLNPAPNSFSPSQTLFSQPWATSTHGLVPASVGVEETSQEVTSSDSIRIPPGQMPISRESQESRSSLKSTAPNSLIEEFVDGLSWEMTASGSIRISPSGQIAVTQKSQETSPTSQNTGEAKTPFKAPDPLVNRDHRWKSKNINVMLSSSPIYQAPSAPNSPRAETAVGPVNSGSPSSDGNIAYHQYLEDNLRAKERGDSPACEGVESQLEIDELDGASSKTSSTDESYKVTDNKQEGPSERSGIMADEGGHIKKFLGDVEVDKQHKAGQGVLEEQEVGLTPEPEALPTQCEKRVEESMQLAEGGGPQESADIGLPDTEDGDHKNPMQAQPACTPVQGSQTNSLGEIRVEEVVATQREAVEARQAEAHGETEPDDAIEKLHGAEDLREGIERTPPSEARETGLAIESPVLLETAREELQDIELQQDSLKIARTVSTSFHRPEPQASKARVRRRLPWHLAEPDGGSPSASVSPPPPPPKQGQVLGKRKQISVGDDVRERARMPPPFSSLKMPVKRANLPEVPLQPLVQRAIKRRKVEFIDTPLMIEFEESESDLDEIPKDNLRPKKKRDGKASGIQVQDGSPFSRNKPFRPPSFAVPSSMLPVDPRGDSNPGEQKVHSSRRALHAHQTALRVDSSTSVRDQLPITPLVHRPRRVSAQSSKVEQRATYRVSSRASAGYVSPVSSLFHEHQSFGHRPSAAPRHSLSCIDHSDFSGFRDDLSIITTDTLPHVDFLKRKPVLKRGSSSTQSLQR